SSGAYLSNEHSGILLLWRQAATLRSNLAELRATAERGLAEAQTDMARTARRLQTACLNLDSNLHLSKSGAACLLEKQALQGALLEQQLREKVQEMIQLQSHWDGEKVELNSRITELTALGQKLKEQNAKKEKTISALKLDVQKLEVTKTGELLEVQDLKDESESLQRIMNSITQLALADAESAGPLSLDSVRTTSAKDPGRQTSPLRSSSSHHRRVSPSRAHSPLRQDAVLQAVQGALRRRQQREQELQLQLESARDMLGAVRKQLSNCQQEVQVAEQQLQEQRQEREELARALQDCRRDLQRCKSSVEILSREKETTEAVVGSLSEQVNSSHLEVERLRTLTMELQKQQSLLEEQKEELAKERERVRKELEQGQRSLEQLEEKTSALKKELVVVKESLNQAILEKDVLENEKEGVSCALSKVRMAMVS
ncbi:ciliary rootlet coiled-coil, rootletin family member 2, partial [Chelydra serpentina]